MSVQVNVCLASPEEGIVDAECQELQDRLPMHFGTLRVQDRRTFEVPLGQPTDVALPTGSRLQFRPISVIRSHLHMQVEMPGIVNTRLQIQSGRRVILAGARHRGGQLIIEVKPVFVPVPEGVEPRTAQTPRLVQGTEPTQPPQRPRRTPDVRRVGATRSGAER